MTLRSSRTILPSLDRDAVADSRIASVAALNGSSLGAPGGDAPGAAFALPGSFPAAARGHNDLELDERRRPGRRLLLRGAGRARPTCGRTHGSGECENGRRTTAHAHASWQLPPFPPAGCPDPLRRVLHGHAPAVPYGFCCCAMNRSSFPSTDAISLAEPDFHGRDSFAQGREWPVGRPCTARTRPSRLPQPSRPRAAPQKRAMGVPRLCWRRFRGTWGSGAGAPAAGGGKLRDERPLPASPQSRFGGPCINAPRTWCCVCSMESTRPVNRAICHEFTRPARAPITAATAVRSSTMPPSVNRRPRPRVPHPRASP